MRAERRPSMRAPRERVSAAIFFPALGEAGAVKFGGAEKRMLRTLNGIAGRGVRVTVVFLSALDRTVIEQSLATVLQPHPIDIGVAIARTQRDVMRFVMRGRFSAILYTDSYRAMMPFLVGGLLMRSRRIMLHVTTFLAPGRFHSRQQEGLFRLVQKLSTHIDVLYPEALDRMMRGNPRAEVTLTPTPAGSLSALDPVEKERTILFLGSLSAVKGADLLIEAAARVQDDLRAAGYRLHIAGSGPMRAQLESMIRRHELSDLVILLGQADPSDVLPSARIFTSLQAHNNYPSQSLIEALGAGCFIVATDEGDSRLLVEEAFGVLVPRTAEGIAAGLLTAIRLDAEELNRATDAARTFFAELRERDRSEDHYLRLMGDL